MTLIEELADRHGDGSADLILRRDKRLTIRDLVDAPTDDLSQIRAGDVVALIGDFDPETISTMLRLIDKAVILVPLTDESRPSHPYFIETAEVDVVIDRGVVTRLRERQSEHPLLHALRNAGHSGLVLFSSGTTGRPKAILHDFELFLRRYRVPRSALRTLNFLLFDHIGGINTLFHTLFNGGCVAVPTARTPRAIIQDIEDFAVELLPTTPTFLRMMLMSGELDAGLPPCLKTVTYGTERMDEPTLHQLCRLLPSIDFKQTYGMSELGILRVRTRSRDSLWMQVGGEAVDLKVEHGVLKIRSAARMCGYLNAPSPFDAEGWYDTKDLVEQDGPWLRIVGRNSDTISVGGIKFLPSEIERVALTHPAVALAHARGMSNPISGQHVELICEPRNGQDLTRQDLRRYLTERLPESMHPHRVKIGTVAVSHRFKQL